MSRIGKKPIAVPDKVEASLADGVLKARGPAGEMELEIPKKIRVEVKDDEIAVNVADPEDKFQRSLWGTYGSLIANLVSGVNEPFRKELEINGVGYGFELSGQKLVVKAGYSHPVERELPPGIKGKVEKNVLVLESPDKELLGRTASDIRSIRKPEPYKGKGIKYKDEQIIRKVGKQVTGTEGS